MGSLVRNTYHFGVIIQLEQILRYLIEIRGGTNYYNKCIFSVIFE